MRQAIFNQGHETGKIAQRLFPGGIDAGIHVPADYTRSIELTTQLIRDGASVIYEAGFSFNQLHCFVDILVHDGDAWQAFEVKSSTQIKSVNILDAAFQYYVMTACGLNVSDISLVVLNSDYERSGELEIQRLFRMESVLNQVLKLQQKVERNTSTLLAMLEGPTAPETDIGPHCTDPHECDFRGHCWAHIPDYSVFDIAGLDGRKKWELYTRGVIELKDIPPDYPLNGRQWQQVHLALSGQVYIDREAIRKFLEGLHYPLHFLDFESFQPAVPLYDRSRPYQQIVFQYSLHTYADQGSEIQHREFLADGTVDPRIPFIESLIRDLGDTGDILVFNQAFEASILKEISEIKPEYSTEIRAILGRIKDLMVPFRQRHIYTPEMRGSYSIKQIYPALISGKDYQELPISDGGSASHAFASLLKESDNELIMETRQNLLAYCKLDTLAMVRILEKLKSLVG